MLISHFSLCFSFSFFSFFLKKISSGLWSGFVDICSSKFRSPAKFPTLILREYQPLMIDCMIISLVRFSSKPSGRRSMSFRFSDLKIPMKFQAFDLCYLLIPPILQSSPMTEKFIFLFVFKPYLQAPIFQKKKKYIYILIYLHWFHFKLKLLTLFFRLNFPLLGAVEHFCAEMCFYLFLEGPNEMVIYS